MNRLPTLLLLLCCAALYVFPCNANVRPPPWENAPARVLVLSSFHPGQPWGDEFVESLKGALQNGDRQVEFYIEYMDAERHHHMGHLEQLVSIYAYRYKHMPPDCVVAFGDQAFEFLRRHGAALFDKAPVVFAGVSNPKRDRLGGYDNFTGTTVSVDAAPTLALIRRLHPAASRLVLIADDTEESLRIQDAVVATAKEIPSLSLDIRQSTRFEAADLFQSVSELGPESVILFAGCSADKEGHYFSSRWCLNRMASLSPVPIYGMLEPFLGNGIVGGELLNAGTLGARAASAAAEVLRGTPPARIPIETWHARQFKFDVRQLRKHRIDEDALPSGSEILYRETGFYERYRTQILAATGVFVAQFITILFLISAVTRRSKAERALRRTEETLDMAVKGAELGLWSLDLSDNSVTLNDRWAEILGYPPLKKTLGLARWVEMVHPEDRDAFTAALMSHLNGERSFFRAEHRITAQDGTLRWIVTRGKTVVRDSSKERRPVRMAGTHLDITDQRAAEAQRNELREQLSQRQRIESIGELAGGIAHDFNNLLSPILGYTDMALSAMDPGEPLFTDLLEIRTAGKRAKDLVSKLLTFGRRQILAPEFLNLNNVTEDLRGMLPHIVRADITLELALAPNIWTVHADPVHVQQILVNLVVNGCDAMPNGGTLRIETRNTRTLPLKAAAETPTASEYVMLRVSDTGTGMSEEIRDKIFAPFFTTKKKGHGTGLGLATVYSVVKQHDGHILVDTAPGKGSSFDIYLPRSTGIAATASEVPVRIAGPESGRTILIAEDNDAVRKLVVDILTFHGGYQVLFAADGVEALEVLREHPGDVHLVLTDVIMPRMNGRKLQRAISTLRPGTPVAFMSGYSDNILGEHGVQDEDILLISKPFSAEELLIFIEKAFLHHRPPGSDAGPMEARPI